MNCQSLSKLTILRAWEKALVAKAKKRNRKADLKCCAFWVLKYFIQIILIGYFLITPNLFDYSSISVLLLPALSGAIGTIKTMPLSFGFFSKIFLNMVLAKTQRNRF
jgi:hypothetical protein